MQLFVTAASDSPTSVPTLSQSIFGNNFVEITALTTLIGSNVAESLILGNHGAAGIAWAATSSFGLLWIVRACISGACPGWLREIMGVRTNVSDQALGMNLLADSPIAQRIRKKIGQPLGITLDARKVTTTIRKQDVTKVVSSWRDTYAFDQSTSKLLSLIPEAGAGLISVSTYAERLTNEDTKVLRKPGAEPIPGSNALSIYTYAHCTSFQHHEQSFHIAALALSLSKVLECLVMWRYSAGPLCIITVVPWSYFFVIALLTEAHTLYWSRKPEEQDGQMDIISGHLPTMTTSGGTRKIILGASHNPKTTAVWRFAWGIGAIICTLCLVTTYMVIGQERIEVVLIWAGFQAFWVLVKMAIYHYAQSTEAGIRMLVERPWETLPDSLKTRARNLAIACAKYQVFLHPRRPIAYEEDTFSGDEIASILADTISMPFYPLPSNIPVVSVNIQAVIGDTILSTAAWMMGWPLAPKDVYDCCIVSISLPSLMKPISVPAVRVVCSVSAAGPSLESPDLENGSQFPQFLPKGSPYRSGGESSWWYYIPCEAGRWLLIRRDVGAKILGKQKVEVLTDNQVTKTLGAGILGISLSHVDEIKETVDISMQARNCLLELMGC